MVKTLLLTMPHKREPAWYLPLGVLYVHNALKSKGYPVDFLDIDGRRMTKDEVIKFLESNKYDVIGLSGLATLFNYTAWISREIKRINPATKVVLGGALGSSHPALVLDNSGVDIIVTGEGEEAIVELIECLDAKDSLSKVKGIYFKEQGKNIFSGPREVIKDLDVVSNIDYSVINLKHYVRPGSLIAGRGCTNRCNFCYQPYKGIRTRSPESLIGEIKNYKDNLGINFFSFLDSYLMSNNEFLLRLCSLLEPLKIKWDCYGRLDRVDRDMLTRMKRAGCIRIGYGVESLSQEVLDAMNKRITLDKITKGLDLTFDVGFQEVSGSFVIGYFNETTSTLNQTIEYAKRWKKLYCTGFYLTPLPATHAYDVAIKEGLIADELAYFQGHLGRGDEFESISNSFYKNYAKMTDQELIDGYNRFYKELSNRQFFMPKVKNFIKKKLQTILK